MDKSIMNNKDLAIVYRIYPKVSKVPPIFSNNKFKLSELCLSSFTDALKGINAKITVLLDNCPPEYFKLFEKYLFDQEFELIALPGLGNGATFGKQMDLLLEQNDSELIYFAEDDYFYEKDAFKKLIDLFKKSNIDFATPYDHDDIYKLDLHKAPSHILLSNDHHWRTVRSTTMTFMTRKDILKKTEKIFRSYIKNNYDASLWLALTGRKLLDPISFIDYSINNKIMRNVYLKGWYFSLFEIIFNKKYNLFSPVPSLATHMDSQHLAPNIDWKKRFESAIRSIDHF
jgi:hypothetical protein